jgi:hypothetical protein
MAATVVTDALVWLAKEVAVQGVRWIFEQAFGGDRRMAGSKVRRFDLSDGAAVTSDADITVQFAGGAGQRLPVVLAFQDYGSPGKGRPFPMLLTDTARVTLRRADYLISALVLWFPLDPQAKPELHGIGWRRCWIAGNLTEAVAISAGLPSTSLVGQLGLVDRHGAPLFTLSRCQSSPPLTEPDTGSSTPTRLPDHRPEPVPASPPGSGQPAVQAGRSSGLCGARLSSGQRCTHAFSRFGLCPTHLGKASHGQSVIWHDGGAPISWPPR